MSSHNSIPAPSNDGGAGWCLADLRHAVMEICGPLREAIWAVQARSPFFGAPYSAVHV